MLRTYVIPTASQVFVVVVVVVLRDLFVEAPIVVMFLTNCFPYRI